MATSWMRVLGPVAISSLLLLGGTVWVVLSQAERPAKGSVSGVRPSVPVVACAVKQRDVPIYRYGIGTVEPSIP